MDTNLTTPPKKVIPKSPFLPTFTQSLLRPRTAFQLHQSQLSKIRTPCMPPSNEQSDQSQQCQTKKIAFFKLGVEGGHGRENGEGDPVEELVVALLRDGREDRVVERSLSVENMRRKVAVLLERQEKEEGEGKQDGQCGKNKNNNKDKHFYKVSPQQHSNESQNKGQLHIQAGSFLTLSSPLPQSLLTLHKQNKFLCPQPQINFIQGYLDSIDSIYYSIETKLILHRPIGPTFSASPLGMGMGAKDLVMDLPQVLYNIVQTGLKLGDLVTGADRLTAGEEDIEGEVLIFCHPYSVELYYVIVKMDTPDLWKSRDKQTNPIVKLELKYSLPDCAKPRHILLSNSSLLYLPDNQFVQLTKICLSTGLRTSISLLSIPPCPSPSPSPAPQAHEPSPFLLQKLADKIINPSSSWLGALSARYLADLRVDKLIGCPHGKFVLCLMEVKVKGSVRGVIGKLVGDEDGVGSVLADRRVVQLYLYDRGNDKWSYQQLRQQNSSHHLLEIRIAHSPKHSQCTCKPTLILHNKLQNRLQAHQYSSPNTNTKQLHPTSIPLSISFPQSTHPLVLSEGDGVMGCVKSGSVLVVVDGGGRAGCVELARHQSTHEQQYLHSCPNTHNHILLTNTGYTRILQVSPQDSLHSLLYTSLTTSKEPTLHISHLWHTLLHNMQSNTYPISSLSVVLEGLLGLALGSAGAGGFVGLYQQKGEGLTIRGIDYGRDNRLRLVAMDLYAYVVDHLEDILSQLQGEKFNIDANQAGQGKNLHGLLKQIQDNLSKTSIKTPTSSPISNSNLNQSPIQSLLPSKPPLSFLSTSLTKISLASVLAQLLLSVWNQAIADISYQATQGILEVFDGVGELCGDYQAVNERLGYGGQLRSEGKMMTSPVSTLAYSTLNHHQPQPTPLPPPPPNFLCKLTQLTIAAHLIKTKHPTLTYRQAYNLDASSFAEYLFQQFVEDYDEDLLEQWEKILPAYVGALCPGKGLGKGDRRSLGFWLRVFGAISGVTSRNKICKVLHQRLSDYHLISQSSPLPLQPSNKPTLLIPDFFIHYLYSHKNFRLQDLTAFQTQNNFLTLSESDLKDGSHYHYICDQNGITSGKAGIGEAKREQALCREWPGEDEDGSKEEGTGKKVPLKKGKQRSPVDLKSFFKISLNQPIKATETLQL